VTVRAGGGIDGFGTSLIGGQLGGRGSFGARRGAVAQPARKNAAIKMMPAGFNTRPLCGTLNRTQAVSIIYDLRYAIYDGSPGPEARQSSIVNRKFAVNVVMLAANALRLHHFQQ
jgi:hypothetical protein